MIELEITNMISLGLQWGVALTMIVGVMAWGVRSVVGLIQQAANA